MTVTDLPVPRRRPMRTREQIDEALALAAAGQDQDVTLEPVYDPEQIQDWQAFALCAQTDPEAFFPDKGGSTKNAKAMCAMCDVRQQCLDYAMRHDERFGVWGGLSERERRKLRRDQAGNPTPPQFVPVDMDADDSPLTQEEIDADFRAEADEDDLIAASVLERMSA